jgi:CheY-like chemotaxis protein
MRTQTQTSTPGKLNGIFVLAIDDEPDARVLVSRILQRDGAHVSSAESAESGFSALREQRPHVIICDISMPVEDGYSFIRRVRELPPTEGGRTPAIALTAFADKEHERAALKAGFDVFMSKPLNSQLLAQNIRTLHDKAAQIL